MKKDTQPDATCDECGDDRKGEPIAGLEIIRGGKKLELRGYLGPFWRTQTWNQIPWPTPVAAHFVQQPSPQRGNTSGPAKPVPRCSPN